MSAYSDIMKEKHGGAAKSCPQCHRLMKFADVNGRNIWMCLHCGAKVCEKSTKHSRLNKTEEEYHESNRNNKKN